MWCGATYAAGLPYGGCAYPPPAGKLKKTGGAGSHPDQVGSGLLFQRIRLQEQAHGPLGDLQVKFGLSYIAVIAAVLLLNTYPLLVSEDLVFHSKETNMTAACRWWCILWRA